MATIIRTSSGSIVVPVSAAQSAISDQPMGSAPEKPLRRCPASSKYHSATWATQSGMSGSSGVLPPCPNFSFRSARVSPFSSTVR